MRATDPQTGISMRFIDSWDVARDAEPARLDVFGSIHDAAAYLVSRDRREISTMQKLVDAYTFLSTMAES